LVRVSRRAPVTRQPTSTKRELCPEKTSFLGNLLGKLLPVCFANPLVDAFGSTTAEEHLVRFAVFPQPIKVGLIDLSDKFQQRGIRIPRLLDGHGGVADQVIETVGMGFHLD